MEPRASARYEVRYREGKKSFVDGLVDVAEALVSGWGGPDAPNAAIVVICEKDGREVVRMRVTGEGVKTTFDRVQSDLAVLSVAAFEREWGITPERGENA